MISELTGVESAYEIPDVIWDRIVSLLPSHKRKTKPLIGTYDTGSETKKG